MEYIKNLSSKELYKYLGVWLMADGKWKSHVVYTDKKYHKAARAISARGCLLDRRLHSSTLW